MKNIGTKNRHKDFKIDFKPSLGKSLSLYRDINTASAFRLLRINPLLLNNKDKINVPRGLPL
jgi:hypothetical protein